MTALDQAPPLPAGGLPPKWRDIPRTIDYRALVESGRISAAGAILLLPRWAGYVDDDSREYVPSLRECFLPRDGCVFSSTDLKVGELFAHGQSCVWLLGYSDLADALNKGADPHSVVAAQVLGISYELFRQRLKDPKYKKLYKLVRQACKPFSFGRPTGMGPAKIVISNRKADPDTPCERGPTWILDADNNRVRGYRGTRFCILVDGAQECGLRKVTRWGRHGFERKIAPTCAHCLEVGVRLSNAWLGAYRENDPYFDLATEFMNHGMTVGQEALDRWPHLRPFYRAPHQCEPAQVMQHFSGRLRKCVASAEKKQSTFSAIANTLFQGLVADWMKRVYWRATVECYDRTYVVPTQAYENSLPSRYGGQQSPLWRSRLPGFFHDEVFGEHARSVAHDAATRISEIAEEEGRYILPYVAPGVQAEPCLQSRWIKSAECIRETDERDEWGRPTGKLVVVDPKYQPGEKVRAAA